MHFVEAKGILSQKNGMNLYRGCLHGCIYCDTRSTCYNYTHPFEDVEVKENAPFLLEKALRSKRRKCMIGTGSMSDPYLPIEEELRLTRRCLSLIEEYGFGATLITKSARVLEDIDLLERINNKTKAVVQMTLTTFDEDLCRILEPNVSTTKERFGALMEFRKRGIPTVVWLSPILPFLNDTMENLDGILDYAVEAGVKGIICFGFGLTLREGSREHFYHALDRSFPGLKEEYIRRFGSSYVLPSPEEGKLWRHFKDRCSQAGILSDADECFRYLNEFPQEKDPQLFFDFQ